MAERLDIEVGERGARVVRRNIHDIGRAANGVTAQVQLMVRALGTLAALEGARRVIQSTVRTFADFEQGLIAVGKTTGASGAELDALGQNIQGLARTIPVATGEMLSVAQAAGQLGVKGNDNILRFTETVSKLGLASNLSGEEAATALARILTVTGDGIEQVDRLGSTIVRLGNNFAATEAEIAGVATRVAQATAQFGVASRDVAGIGTALRAVGIEAEAGGTVVGRAFQAINDAVRQGGDELKALERITGQTGAELERVFFEDSVQSFRSFVEGLARIQAGGGDVTAALKSMGLEGVRVSNVLGTIATRSGVLADALNQANDEWGRNEALTREAAVAATSFTAQMQLLGNAMDEAAAEIGKVLAPTLLDAANGFRDFLIAGQDTGQLTAALEQLGRVLSAVAIIIGVRFVQAQHASIAASLNNARATRAALAAEVERTATIRTLRLWQLEQARATATGVAATDLAAAANIRATAATRAHAAAQAQYAAATRTSAIATRGLTTAMGFLGGPAGVIALAGFAIYAFAEANDEAAGSVEGLTGNLDAFRRSLEELSRFELQSELVRQLKQLEEARARADETLFEQTGRGAVGLLVAGVGIVEDVVSATAGAVKDAVGFVWELPEHLISQPRRLSGELDEITNRTRQIAELERQLAATPGAGEALTPTPALGQTGTGVVPEQTDERTDATNKVIEALEFERAQLNRSAEAQALYNNLREANTEADSKWGRVIRALTLENLELAAQEEQRTAALEAQLDAQEALAQSEINNRNATLDRIATLREEIENHGKSRLELAALNEEKRHAAETDETLVQKAVALAVVRERQRIASEEERRASEERRRAAEAEQRRIDDLATALASNLTSSFEDAVFAGESFGNVLTGLADDMARLIFRITVLEPLTHSLAEAFGRGSSGGGLVGFLTSLAGGVGRGIAGGASSPFSLSGASDPLGLSGIRAEDVLPLDLKALKFQTGGLIPGALGAGPDSLLARLTPGEFVVNAQATRAYLPLLEALNDAPGFQYGGRVDASAFQLPAGVASSAAPNVIINVTSQVPGVEVEAQARPPSGPRGDQFIDVMIMESLGRAQRRGELGDLLGGYGVQKRLKDRG